LSARQQWDHHCDRRAIAPDDVTQVGIGYRRAGIKDTRDRWFVAWAHCFQRQGLVTSLSRRVRARGVNAITVGDRGRNCPPIAQLGSLFGAARCGSPVLTKNGWREPLGPPTNWRSTCVAQRSIRYPCSNRRRGRGMSSPAVTSGGSCEPLLRTRKSQVRVLDGTPNR